GGLAALRRGRHLPQPAVPVTPDRRSARGAERRVGGRPALLQHRVYEQALRALTRRSGTGSARTAERIGCQRIRATGFTPSHATRPYAVPGNYKVVSNFVEELKRLWLVALRRRSQKSRMTWDRFGPLANGWLPRIRIMHPYPEQ